MKHNMNLIALSLYFLLLASGCKKDKLTANFIVEVADYLSGQPIENARLLQASAAGIDFSCGCMQPLSYTLMGHTNSVGQKSGFSNFDYIITEKDGYHSSEGNDYCVRNETTYKFKVFLFKQAFLNVSFVSSRSNLLPYVQIAAVLKDGSVKSLADNRKFFIDPTIGFVMNRKGAGDMQNRILVLQYDIISRITDTLANVNIFLPSNTTQQVTVNY